MSTRRDFMKTLGAGVMAFSFRSRAVAEPKTVRSIQSGLWSSPATWENHELPAAGAIVAIRPGHKVVYDCESSEPLRLVHVAGSLAFARDRNTRMDVGLLKVGGTPAEEGFDRASHEFPSGVLEIGTSDDPIPAGYAALVRLVYFEGSQRESLPALLCCGGRMDIHGAPMNRTWIKLGAPAKKGDTEVRLAETVTGWRPGCRVILTATTRQAQHDFASTRDSTQTEERIIQNVRGTTIELDQPLLFDHACDGIWCGEIANLSRNVVIESADPHMARGHVMYHHGSAGSISYAEFRHLGKRGVLGRYSLHFHKVRDSMRGSSVVGASIWHSGNRWIALHGTDYMVVRDCVGYNSLGHGFFLEDGTEVFNTLDRNLAVQACKGQALPGQALLFDLNDGAGFWWANSFNTFTRNVACECDEYGFRFDAVKTASFNPVLSVPQPDGSLRVVDVRTLPFIRFEDNESHCQRRHAFNLGGVDELRGGGCDGVGPDIHHPFVIRNLRVWDSQWAFHGLAPCVMIDGFRVHHCSYGFWFANLDRHAHRGINMDDITVSENQLPDGVPPKESDFPRPLAPIDDLPPVVVVTHVAKQQNGKLVVRGTASDTGQIHRLQVNGHEAHATRGDFAEWEAHVDSPASSLVIRAQDSSGNSGVSRVEAWN
jgi:hypothetical protein